MEIKVTVKQLGKKHPFLKEKPLIIKDLGSTPTLKEFIEAVVEQQVEQYNHKETEDIDSDLFKLPKNNYLPFLTDTGKISFGSLYNKNKADVEMAKETAVQAFEDGMYAIFLDEEELTKLTQTIEITTDRVFTFIRLTFLAGSYW